MRIVILGAGSLGSVIGGALAASGQEVTLVTRNAAHLAAVKADGLVLETDAGAQIVHPAAALTPEGIGPVDLVVVLVKSLDTEAAITAARGMIGPQTVVLTLQNGLGQEEILARVAGRASVIAGKCYVGGLMTAPGRVMAGYAGKETIIGELDGAITPRITAIAEAFRAARLETIVSPDIMGAMWDKLLVNAATGALAAITRLTYGDLYRVPEIEQTAIAAVAEGMAVARALGITLSTDDPAEPWRKAGAGLPSGFRTSMLQSLDRGALTEIDFINGAVVRAGLAAGVPTPVNATLVALVKGLEVPLRKGVNHG